VADSAYFAIHIQPDAVVLRLRSRDGLNRLSQDCVLALTEAVHQLALARKPLVIAGNEQFFSVGADLHEIARLFGSEANAFSKIGRTLMNAVEQFPLPVCAAIQGHCLGGGLDLALACHLRIGSPAAVFGHRGAALGLITGWGGTQRLPRLVDKGKALQMFVAAEKIGAAEALRIGLVNAIADDPVQNAVARIRQSSASQTL
jgi:enoyl-CoA hydratase